MSSWLPRTMIALVWLASGVALGLVIGRHRDAFPIEFKKEFDVVDIANLMVTLAVALFLQNYVTDRAESKRAIRGRVAELSTEMRVKVEELHRLIRWTATPPHETFLHSLTIVDRAESRLRTAMERAAVPSEGAIREAWKKLRDAISGGAYPHRAYTIPETTRIDRAYDDLLHDLELISA